MGDKTYAARGKSADRTRAYDALGMDQGSKAQLADQLKKARAADILPGLKAEGSKNGSS